MLSPQFNGRDTVRWGIVGCGDVTEVKSGPGFQKAERSQLVAVMRRTGDRAADYAKRHGVARWYDDADKLINDPEVDAVYVATPPDTHELYTGRALDAGKPVYVEKPMGRNAAECERMVAAAETAGQKLFVAYYRRRLPRFEFIKDCIDTGKLGTLTSVGWRHSQPAHLKPDVWRVTAAAAGGGHFLDLASHALDVFDFLLGPLESASGVAANLASAHDVEDSVTMSFLGGGRVPGALTCNFACASVEDRLELVGTKGRLSTSVFGDDAIVFEGVDGVESYNRPNPPHVAQPLIQSVVDDLLGRGTCPSTGQTALRTNRVMDQVLEGYYGDRKDGFWNRAANWPGRQKGGS
jgi:predicted dehydrogenase